MSAGQWVLVTSAAFFQLSVIAWVVTGPWLHRRHKPSPAPAVRDVSGAHEACELTRDEELVWERYATPATGASESR